MKLYIISGNIAVVHYSISKDNRYINFKANPNSADCENMFSNMVMTTMDLLFTAMIKCILTVAH